MKPVPSRTRAPGALALPAAVAAIVLVLAAQFAACARGTGGGFACVLDDSYIELAMARSIAEHGRWSLDGSAFQPAASSPLWTAVLALAVRAFGPREVLPFTLNVGVAIGLVLLLDRVLRDAFPGPWPRAAAAVAIALLAPVGVFATTGMEHGLHAVLALALAWTAARRLGGGDAGSGAALAGLAALATLTRFESLALIGVAAGAALLRRRTRDAAWLVTGALAGLGAYAGFAFAHGGDWLPNSVLLKSTLTHGGRFDVGAFLTRLPVLVLSPRNAHFAMLLMLAPWLARRRGARQPHPSAASRAMLALVAPTIVLALQFGSVGSFFRYEAWLVVLGATAVALALPGFVRGGARRTTLRRPAGIALAVAVALLAGSLALRATRATAWAPRAARNIHEQQRQMGRFVGAYFAGETVAASDIGAVAWYGRTRVFDLAGLGDMTVARRRRAGGGDAAWLARACKERGVPVALLHPHWLRRRGGVPPGWHAASHWVIRDNYVTDGDTVAIYSTAPAHDPRVIAALRRFEPGLPARVGVIAGAPR